jgi:hypothetical protein
MSNPQVFHGRAARAAPCGRSKQVMMPGPLYRRTRRESAARATSDPRAVPPPAGRESRVEHFSRRARSAITVQPFPSCTQPFTETAERAALALNPCGAKCTSDAAC